MAYTRAGLTPDLSSTYFLARVVGLRRAMELTLTNRVLSAAEAAVSASSPGWCRTRRCAPRSTALAAGFAAGPTAAFGATKRLLHTGWTATLETQMEIEGRAIADVARGPDAREGIAAFVAKRPPRFIGR